MSRAVNYARHRVTRQYVFLACEQRPLPAWLTAEWVWYREIERHLLPDDVCPLYRVQLEDAGAYCDRLDHAPRTCAKCRSQTLASHSRMS